MFLDDVDKKFVERINILGNFITDEKVKEYVKAMEIYSPDNIGKSTRQVPKVTKLDTHPPIPERLSTLKESLQTQLDEIPKEEPESTKLRWKYYRDLNLLKFIPI